MFPSRALSWLSPHPAPAPRPSTSSTNTARRSKACSHSAEFVASLTDDAGEGTMVDYSRVALFKDGYHPLMDGNDQPYTHMDAPWGAQADPRVMWKLRDADPREVSVDEVEVPSLTSHPDQVELELPPELGIQAHYTSWGSFQVTAPEGSLVPSERFYFAGPSQPESQETLEGDDVLAFYVLDAEATPRFKVCLVDRYHVWVGLGARQVNTIRWLWTEVDDLDTPVVLLLTDAQSADQAARIVDPSSGPSFELDGDLERIRSAVETNLGPLGIPERLQGWLDRLDDAR